LIVFPFRHRLSSLLEKTFKGFLGQRFLIHNLFCNSLSFSRRKPMI
jgi:hypothetical protein